MIPWDELRQEVVDHPCPLLFATISGAHLYGFPSPDSDYDLRGVHIMTAGETVGLWPKHETLERSHVRAGLEMDLVTHDILKFFRLLLKRNGYVLEQLYSPLTSAEKDFHRSEYSRLVTLLEEAGGASALPEAPTAGPALNDLLVRLRLR
jgi:predicted nucleotidyltransferase